MTIKYLACPAHTLEGDENLKSENAILGHAKTISEYNIMEIIGL